MIGYLKGKVISADTDTVILDVNGVGYTLYCSSKIMAAMVEGSVHEFHVNTVVKEDSISLYGFSSKEDKASFLNLQTVQGVGPRMALSILSMMSPEEIVHAIISEDISSFKKVSGVGPKLAARIVNELKDKKSIIPIISKSTAAGQTVLSDFSTDAVSALVNLGFARKDAFFAVKNIIAENDNIDLEDTLKLALSKLSGQK